MLLNIISCPLSNSMKNFESNDMRHDFRELTDLQVKIVRELKRLQAENDTLVGRNSVLADQMASELINLPDTMEDMQLLLLTYRGQAGQGARRGEAA